MGGAQVKVLNPAVEDRLVQKTSLDGAHSILINQLVALRSSHLPQAQLWHQG